MKRIIVPEDRQSLFEEHERLEVLVVEHMERAHPNLDARRHAPPREDCPRCGELCDQMSEVATRLKATL